MFSQAHGSSYVDKVSDHNTKRDPLLLAQFGEFGYRLRAAVVQGGWFSA